MNVTDVNSASNTYATQFQSQFKQRATDFKALGSALQSGDLAGAQTAFASLPKDSSSSASGTNPNSQATKDLEALKNALQSGDVAGAQQAFATMRQDMQKAHKSGHGHHHHATAATSGTDATSGASPTATAPASSSTMLAFNQFA
jgi:ribosomal protein S20